ncbi:hypothetical protein PG301_05340 [Parageobacillus sp. G301]|nr:hypothetical protein PG301_05340 [Parageobacillus sp. G301]
MVCFVDYLEHSFIITYSLTIFFTELAEYKR